MRARLLVIPLALFAISAVPAAQTATPNAPTGLRAFLLRADEAPSDTFSRTPSFAWTPYARAKSYDFELATSKSFDDSTIVWSTDTRKTPLLVPAIAIPIALPWMTGNPYALYAHVRAHTISGVTAWSVPFGFNMRWNATPQEVTPTIRGLVRWTPVAGATSYQVWFIDPGKVITTTTNVADEREFYSFHPDGVQWTTTVRWRVRAVRELYGSLPNGLPVVSYGPWSQMFISANSANSTGPLTLLESVSDKTGSPLAPTAHSLTPGFVYSGDTAFTGSSARLYRVYVATDEQCVNIVYTGAVVGSPAYAPRTSGPLALPTTPTDVATAQVSWLKDGSQPGTFSADLRAVTTTEAASAASSGTTSAYSIPTDLNANGAAVDLWDSGWPAGRYYWTVVPVREVTAASSVTYYDAEVPQDACAAGRVAEFGKVSQPAAASEKKPYASGLSPTGELVAAQTSVPTFYRAALIAWVPALGATGYEVQWSHTLYPWKTASTTPLYTAATSVLLEGLTPGTWYYRVRGIDPYVPGPVKQMTWSDPIQFKLAKPTYSVQDGSVIVKPGK